MVEEHLRKRRRRRNKFKMRMDLLEAVSQVLKTKGYIALNINNVCEAADVDRNAIYRHFNDFEGLLSQFIESKDFWLEALGKLGEEKVTEHKDYYKNLLHSQYEKINKNKELQQLLVWELCELSLRTKTVAERREVLSEDLIKQYEKHFEGSGLDFNAISAIILAGIYYLIVHKKHSTFCRVDFAKEKQRMLSAIDQLVEMLFDAKDANDKTRIIAKKALSKGIKKETVAEITGLTLDEIKGLV